MSLPLDKNSIRKTLLQRRRLLSRAEVKAMSIVAQQRLMRLAAFQCAKMVALYSPIQNEVETDRILSVALAKGQQVCYPVVVDQTLCFYEVLSSEDLQPGLFGIGEPVHRLIEVAQDQIELLVVPGVAFDRSGHRIGYGQGFFDRLLEKSSFHGLSVGFGFDFQIQDLLPFEEHDQQLALLVTDKGIYSPS